MEKKKITYEDVIYQLKQHTPTAANPEELIASILTGIRNLPEKNKNKRIRIIARICGTIAACLTGLLLMELFGTPVYNPQETAFTLPASYSTKCGNEKDASEIILCFLKERKNKKLQKDFLIRNLKKQ